MHEVPVDSRPADLQPSGEIGDICDIGARHHHVDGLRLEMEGIAGCLVAHLAQREIGGRRPVSRIDLDPAAMACLDGAGAHGGERPVEADIHLADGFLSPVPQMPVHLPDRATVISRCVVKSHAQGLTGIGVVEIQDSLQSCITVGWKQLSTEEEAVFRRKLGLKIEDLEGDEDQAFLRGGG